jgi:hypothetical protein
MKKDQFSSVERKRRIGVIPESVSTSSVQDQQQQQQPKPSSSSQQQPHTSNSSATLIKVASTLENQVGYEDAMISGLLSTLNEEAQEDVLSEELRGSSENVSFNVSLENLHKSYETISPTPSQFRTQNSHR